MTRSLGQLPAVYWGLGALQESNTADMEFDQAFAGNGDWTFPSPGATPTGQTLNHHQLLQTPKNAAFPSHFQDAFTTPQMPSYTTPQQQQYPAMTPIQRAPSSSDTLRSNYYAMQANGTPGLQPPAQQNIQAAVISPMQGHEWQALQPQPQPMLQPSFDSTQMQTPPPTRGTSAKKPLQPAQIAFGTPSTIATRRFMSPQQPLVSNGLPLGPQTPLQYPQLQFSPDVYQFGNLGPASAPVMPQTQLLWDQMRSPVAYTPQQTLEDPFAPHMQHTPAWPHPSPNQNFGPPVSFGTPAMASFAVQPPHPRPSSAAPAPGFYVPSSAPPAPNAASLDPSLIYSSPVHPIVRSSSRSSMSRPEPRPLVKRKDSALQKRASKESISPTEVAPAPAFTGPGLRRSNTTGTARPKTAQSTAGISEALSRSNTIMGVPRTASPLKRVGRTPLGAISEHKPRKRASVILTIDANGLARTETRPVEDSPTKSIRDRYPGLFDSDSSDDESDTSEQPLSRTASFSFAKGEERRAKAARLDPPVENLEGLSIPRSGSSASMNGVAPSRAAIAAAAQLRRQSSIRKSGRTIAAKRNPMTSSTGSLIDSCPMDVASERQQAGAGAGFDDGEDTYAEPPKITKRGTRSSGSQSTLEAHNRRWSMMSYEHQQQPLPMGLPSQPLPYQGYNQPQSRTGPIRCVCGVTQDQGQPLIQCRSCTQWLHTPCVGLHAQHLPMSYTCFLCTKPASRLR